MVAGNLFLVMVFITITIMNNIIIRGKWCPARCFVGDCMPGATLFLRCAGGWKGDDDDDDMNEDLVVTTLQHYPFIRRSSDI